MEDTQTEASVSSSHDPVGRTSRWKDRLEGIRQNELTAPLVTELVTLGKFHANHIQAISLTDADDFRKVRSDEPTASYRNSISDIDSVKQFTNPRRSKWHASSVDSRNSNVSVSSVVNALSFFACAPHGCLPISSGPECLTKSSGTSDQDSWEQRRKTQGCVARLVKYSAGSPVDDIDLQEAWSGPTRVLVVVRLAYNGNAYRCGLAIGDRLVSVDGRRDMQNFRLGSLKEPLPRSVTLVFLGFVGSARAEVRLSEDEEPFCAAGLGSKETVLESSEKQTISLVDQRVFESYHGSAASLLFSMAPHVVADYSCPGEMESESIFELRSDEASRIVREVTEQFQREDTHPSVVSTPETAHRNI